MRDDAVLYTWRSHASYFIDRSTDALEKVTPGFCHHLQSKEFYTSQSQFGRKFHLIKEHYQSVKAKEI